MTGCFLLALAATLAGPGLGQPGSSASRQPIDLLVQQGARLDDNVLTLSIGGGRGWEGSPEDLTLLREVPGHIDVVVVFSRLGDHVGAPAWDPYLAALRGAALKRVDLESRMVTEDGILRLTECASLEELNFSEGGVPVSDAVLACLPQIPGLKRLCLFCPFLALSDEGLANLGRLSGVEQLWLIGRAITDQRLAYLSGLSRLSYLGLASTRVEGPGLAHLAGAKGLAVLYLTGTNLDDADLVHLRGVTSLEELHPPLRMFDYGLKVLADLPNLKVLDLSRRNVSDEGLRHLADFPALKTLDLSDTLVTDAGLRHLAGLTKLESLNLPKAAANDAGLSHLVGLRNLRSLGLDRRPDVTDAGLEYLGHLESLESLDLSGSKITADGLRHLAGLRKIEQLSLPRVELSDAVLDYIVGLPELKSLRYSSPGGVDDAVLKRLAEARNLEELHLGQRTDVTDAGLECLRSLSLRSLSIGGENLSNAGMEQIAGIYSLRTLSVAGPQISLRGIVHLAQSTNLRELAVTTDQPISETAQKYIRALTGMRGGELKVTSFSPGVMQAALEALLDGSSTPGRNSTTTSRTTRGTTTRGTTTTRGAGNRRSSASPWGASPIPEDNEPGKPE